MTMCNLSNDKSIENILCYFFDSVKMVDIKKEGSLDTKNIIKQRIMKTKRYQKSNDKEHFFDYFDNEYVLDFLKGNEDILIEYLRKCILMNGRKKLKG